MDKIKEAFNDFFGFRLKMLNDSGTITNKNKTIKYLLGVGLSGKPAMDLLIFQEESFPHILHKRINYEGVIMDLENFQFSILYETETEGETERAKMKLNNNNVAKILINKGLAKKNDKWINEYLNQNYAQQRTELKYN